MGAGSAGAVALLVLLATFATWDLSRQQAETLVVYTTPALREFLEDYAFPAFAQQTGVQATGVYLAAGQQMSRLRISGSAPEADVILHASPFFIEQAHAQGRIEDFRIPDDQLPPASFLSAQVDDGAHYWYAFAWTPLVIVHRAGTPAPDLERDDYTLGLSHPRLSNNGVYNVILLEAAGPQVKDAVLSRVVAQPVDARATLTGVANGDYDVALGYESAALFFEGQGAPVTHTLPTLGGRAITTPVLMTAAVTTNHPHAQAEAFVKFLFEDATQAKLSEYGLRSPRPTAAPEEAQQVTFTWSRWQRLEDTLPRYEVA